MRTVRALKYESKLDAKQPDGTCPAPEPAKTALYGVKLADDTRRDDAYSFAKNRSVAQQVIFTHREKEARHRPIWQSLDRTPGASLNHPRGVPAPAI